MAEDRVETVRSIYEAWAKGDFTAGVELHDPLILLVQSEGFPESGAYLGPEGMNRYMRTFLEAWEQVTIEADELTGVGDCVVAEVTQRGVGRGSAAETEFAYFQVWTFRGESVIRIDVIRERDDAFRAAGVTE
jgi:ketosteroid isomerase-like protein